MPCDPALMDCSIPGITLANMPIKPGGWRLNNASSMVYECFNPDACTGNAGVAGSNATQIRRQLSLGADISTAGNDLCAPGHTGFLCGACIEDWYGYKDDKLCSECEGNTALAFVPLILLVVAALLASLAWLKGGSLINFETLMEGGAQEAIEEAVEAKREEALAKIEESQDRLAAVEDQAPLTKKQKRLSMVLKVVSVGNKVVTFIQKSKTKIKILISLWQILQGLGATFAIPFPPFYSQAVSAVGGLLQIELPSIMPLDCMWPTNFYSKLIFKCVWPLCTYALLALLSKVLRKFGKDARADGCIDFGFFLMVCDPSRQTWSESQSLTHLSPSRQLHVALPLHGQFILYPSISNGLLSIFYCVPLKDGTSWLRVDLSIQCADASGTIARHTTMLIFAFVMLGLHTVGTPALYGYLFFWKHKGVLDALKEQVLRFDSAPRLLCALLPPPCPSPCLTRSPPLLT